MEEVTAVKPPQAMDRRAFLRRVAAPASLATAFPAIVPSSVFGRNAPSNRITLASLGVGGRGTGVMGGFARHGDAQFLAVCDPFEARRERARATLDQQYGKGTVAAYADFREVLARDDVDAVIICTPDHWHVPLAIAAGRSGKDMYVEKPLGVSVEWAKVLRDVVRRYGNVFQYGTQQRSNWQFRFACELARNGYLGALKWVDVWCPHLGSGAGSTTPAPVPDGFDYDLWLGPAPTKPYTKDRCTSQGAYHIHDYAIGFIAGWGAHPLDIAQWGLGTDRTSPVFYEGNGDIPAKGLFDTVANWDVRCRYADGVELRFRSAAAARKDVMTYRPAWCDHGTTFFGAEGWVSVNRGGLYASDPRLLKAKLGPNDTRLKASRGQDRDLLDCIRTREPTVNPVESAIRSDAVSHLSEVAVRCGRPIEWDPGTEQIVGDAVAARMLDRPLRAPWHL